MNISVFVSLSGISRSSYQGAKGTAIEYVFDVKPALSWKFLDFPGLFVTSQVSGGR